MPSAPGTAPAGASAKPTADILFTVLAPSAQLSTDTLVLQNVAPLVPFYRTDGNTGLYTTGAPHCKLCLACGMLVFFMCKMCCVMLFLWLGRGLQGAL